MGALSRRDLVVAIGIAASLVSVAGVGIAISEPRIATMLAQVERPLSLPAYGVLKTIRVLALVAGGVAFWLVWRACERADRPRAMILPGVLWLGIMAVDVVWHVAFHALRRFDLALTLSVLEFVMAIAIWRVFRRHSKLAGGLILLILIWIFYTLREAHRFWQLNPTW